MNLKIVLGVIVLAMVLYAGYEFVRISALIRTSSQLVMQAKPFERGSGTTSMLVLGDSTAAGVGATNPQDSVPGRVANLLNASVENYAVSGAVTTDMQGQLGKAKLKHYDLILIQVGANDVVRLHSLDAANEQMNTLLQEAQKYSDHVVLLTAGRIGDAPLLPIVTRPLFNYRAAQLKKMFMQTAAQNGVLYVDLSDTSDTFQSDPKLYYAPDMFHPSSAGYELWFDDVREAIEKNWPQLVYEK